MTYCITQSPYNGWRIYDGERYFGSASSCRVALDRVFALPDFDPQAVITITPYTPAPEDNDLAKRRIRFDDDIRLAKRSLDDHDAYSAAIFLWGALKELRP